MLSISPIASSAGGAASYYLSEEKNLNLPDVSLEKAADAKEGEANYYVLEQSAANNARLYLIEGAQRKLKGGDIRPDLEALWDSIRHQVRQ